MSTPSDTEISSGPTPGATPLSPEDVRGLSPGSIYGRDVQAVAQDLDVDIEKGLSMAEAANRLDTYGPNKLAEIGRAHV